MGFLVAQEFTDPATGAAVPSAAADGVEIPSAAKSFRVILSAVSGQTLSGSGNLEVWYYSPSAPNIGWGENLDLAMAVSVSGARTQVFPDVSIGPGCGRIRVLPVTVGISGGTNVTIRIEFGT
jgi:hypothetical protein